MSTLARSIVEKIARSVQTYRAHGLDAIEQRIMAQREFTALLPLREGASIAALRRELRAFSEGRNDAFRELPGLHSARWVLLEDEGHTGAEEGADAAAGPLVLAMVCDGWPLDVLEELAERGDSGLDAILRHCAGYADLATPDARVAYLRSYRARSSYFFTDSRQDDVSAPCLHASAREIRRALKLREVFVQYVIESQGKEPREQQQAFEALRAEWAARDGMLEASPIPGYPFELSPLERRLDHEGLWIRRTAEIVRTRARRDIRRRREAKLDPVGLRQVHAKHYGLLEARLRVRHDLPDFLRAGVFVPGAEYAAWVRPSSTSPSPQPDYKPDGRGLAIKLLDVGSRGRPVLPRPIDDGLSLGEGITQDFVLVSNPTFFVRNARDYALLRALFDANPDDRSDRARILASKLLFAWRRRPELLTFMRTLLCIPRHPLLVEYHSMVPILVGRLEAIKLSVRPTEATRRALSGETPWKLLTGSVPNPNDYLRLALQRSLDLLGTLQLELVAHVAGERSLPVEDAMIDWGKLGAKEIVVATLEIPQQDAISAQRLALGERMIFTPWHALEEHRPLSSLNRSRLFSYLASAQERLAGDAARPPRWSPPDSPGPSNDVHP
jgi:hypothetical protein